ncbi:N-acyl-aromatic-L-amino acid amidohydrolase (carboxylate-forming) isoform X1 [Antechinus flavipes]|uniref:N-acyl-aromatic-L-amino acid amidohydrolase (carboxylate-forming) isoform X1 n=2 Tax=Antechinus flavipes TaxID=38775 RepID=UPI00223689BB|nr:N-acyl-aromatic-L-amino acid amidohydrolase (carboxylate-forming) isoform X1 [Antechinus flavipes]
MLSLLMEGSCGKDGSTLHGCSIPLKNQSLGRWGSGGAPLIRAPEAAGTAGTGSRMCSTPSMGHRLNRVAVMGGTHGNELSGVYLVKHWLQDPSELQRRTFTATPFLANPKATKRCVRYISQDLNRSFTKAFLLSKGTKDDLYEVSRAQEINQLFGPRGSADAVDFIFDLHNTTSNMAACLISDSEKNVFTMHMCHYIQKHTQTPCPIYLYGLPGQENYSLMSVAKNSLGLELGPQPHGVLRADVSAHMRALLACGLDFIDLFNQGTSFPAFDMVAYKLIESVHFPRSPEGELLGIVHPQLQDKDFLPLKPGEPIFQLFSGEEIFYEGDVPIYPAFINEAAYYEKGVAFLKLEKSTFSIPPLEAPAASAP